MSAGNYPKQRLMMSIASNPTIVICTPTTADDLDHFAAAELKRYLVNLYQIDARIGKPEGEDIAFLLGHADVNPCVKRMADDRLLPEVTDQGFVLRTYETRGKRGMIIAGGSPAATMWGVYELIERLGVVYTLNGDIFPEDAGQFELLQLDETFEPTMRFRAFRMFNEHTASPASFGLEEQRRCLDQLAKMKFNGVMMNFWAHQPFIHFEFRGVARQTAENFWGWRYPTKGMVGEAIFEGAKEFCNPSLPPDGTYAQRIARGQAYMHAVLAHVKQRGMESIIGFSLTEFTDEFIEGFREWCPQKNKPDLSQWKDHYTREGVFSMGGDPQFSEYQDFFNPVLQELVDTIIRAHIDEYPEADYYALNASEFRSSAGSYKKAWDALDQRHPFDNKFNLKKMLADAHQRLEQRGVNEVQGDIEFLYFVDELIHGRRVLERSTKPDAKIVVGNPCGEMYGPYAHVLGDCGVLGAVDAYSAAGSAKNIDKLKDLDAITGPKFLILTLSDDNIAAMVQHVAKPTQTLIRACAQRGFDGYVVRCFMYGEMDPGAAYLSKISWDLDAQPNQVLAERMNAICGPDAVEPALKALDMLDDLTELNLTWFIFGFPVPSMISHYFQSGKQPSDNVASVLNHYRDILPHLQAAYDQSIPRGRNYIGYFLRRCEFIIELLPALWLIASCGEAHNQFQVARKSVKVHDAYTLATKTMGLGIEARERVKRALQIHAGILRDGVDRGLFAALNRYIYQYLDAQMLVLETDLSMWSVTGEDYSQVEDGGGAI